MFDASTSRIHLTNLQINLIISSVASLLFFSGWWIVGDKDVYRTLQENKSYYIPAVVGTVAFFSIILVPAHFFYDSFTYQQRCFVPSVARIYLLCWLTVSFGCLFGAFYILVNEFILKSDRMQWPGYGICLQNVFIFLSTILLRFARKHDMFY